MTRFQPRDTDLRKEIKAITTPAIMQVNKITY
ncbi:hypothetical protein KN1_03690 [Stygiolobus caldivivus]|uniref:Uncharacterized protein n=1 Tax=Stygiolobus caldivivus TaxID=2824673 RepID=A0A8D5U4F9_9CREN|nr:hypothetical protein KN1_03690 [Stygiolobus caldivivus]